MITKEIAMSLHHGQTLYHPAKMNADGSALRCRVNGKCKTWKTRPNEFQLPVKYGFKTYFYITHDTNTEWSTEEPSISQKCANPNCSIRIDRRRPEALCTHCQEEAAVNHKRRRMLQGLSV